MGPAITATLLLRTISNPPLIETPTLILAAIIGRTTGSMLHMRVLRGLSRGNRCFCNEILMASSRRIEALE